MRLLVLRAPVDLREAAADFLRELVLRAPALLRDPLREAVDALFRDFPLLVLRPRAPVFRAPAIRRAIRLLPRATRSPAPEVAISKPVRRFNGQRRTLTPNSQRSTRKTRNEIPKPTSSTAPRQNTETLALNSRQNKQEEHRSEFAVRNKKRWEFGSHRA